MDAMYLPVFVYGSLMPGQANFTSIQRWVVDSAPAYLPEARLWVGEAFPIAQQYRGSFGVRGYILAIDQKVYRDALAELDDIEAFNGPGRSDNLYVRTAVTVHVDAGPGSSWFGKQMVRAWAYVGSEETLEGINTQMKLSKTGDWLKDVMCHYI